jgi:predicted phage-related endonuclease
MINGRLEVAEPNMAILDDEEFSLKRRKYLGASDASVLLGVNLFKDLEDLRREKNSTVYTQDEQKVSQKVNIRKGSDLEPLILKKFEDKKLIEVMKPKDMYKFVEYPFLAVNFDGVIKDSLIPVEAKFVSAFAEKYWDKTVYEDVAKDIDMRKLHDDIVEHIKAMARMHGIPPYYYTQVQQEIYALNAPYGYLAAIFDKYWDFHIFRINRDDHMIMALLGKAEKFWREKMNGNKSISEE